MFSDSDKEWFWGSVNKGNPNSCWIWQGAYFHNKPYGLFSCRYLGARRSHRVAYMLANNIEAIPENLVVRHTCDNPGCCNPQHLILGTPKENSQDMCLRKRTNNGRSISDEIIQVICIFIKEGKNNLEIERLTGVSNSYISKIRNGHFRKIDMQTIYDLDNA